MFFPRAKTQLVSLLLLGIIGFAVMWPGMRIPYYADDFQFYFPPPAPSVHQFFAHTNQYNPAAYRPLPGVISALLQSSGPDTFALHVAQTGLHIVVAGLVFMWIAGREKKMWAPWLGALFMLVSQGNAHAVLSNDTLSQVMATLLGLACVWLLCAATARDSVSRPRYALSVLAFVLALFCKETATSCAIMAAAVVAITRGWRGPGNRRVRTLGLMVPFAVLLVGYFILRGHVGANHVAFGSRRYDLQIGMNVIKNFAMLSFEALLPISSVDVYTAVQERHLAVCLWAVFLTLVLGVMVLVGLWRGRRRGLAAAMLAFAALGLVPVIFMNQVSELYIYNSMPFVAVLVGIGIAGLIESTRGVKRGALVASFFAFLVLNAMAIRSKAALMDANGREAAVLCERIEPHLRDVPDHGELVLVNPPPSRPEYSVFVLNGFSLFRDGTFRLNQLAENRPFQVRIESSGERPPTAPGAVVLTLTVPEHQVVRVPAR